MLSPVPKRETTPRTPRKPFTGRGLIREVSYLHEDEAAALEKRADRERCSKAEIIRRALRAYLGIED
jgi:Ribbon-helix-helix protein, copG family